MYHMLHAQTTMRRMTSNLVSGAVCTLNTLLKEIGIRKYKVQHNSSRIVHIPIHVVDFVSSIAAEYHIQFVRPLFHQTMACATYAESANSCVNLRLVVEYLKEQQRPTTRRQRIHKLVRQKVQWTCDKCKSGFVLGDDCPDCGHHKCDDCVRSP